MTRKEQKEQRRKEILNAALSLFVRKGYSETKISDIAGSVGMSTGLLFHYFESKEKVYEELVKIGLEGTKMPLAQKLPHAVDYFTVFTQGLFAMMKKDPVIGQMFILMEAAQRSEGTPENVRRIAESVDTIEKFVPIIEAGQKEGTIREGNPLVLSMTFWCCIHGIASNFVMFPESELPDPEWIVDIVRKK